MNKTELIDKVAAKTGFTKKDVDTALSAILEIITDTLSKDEKVQLVGFGSFETKLRAARTARNPKANVPVKVAPTKTAQFKPGKNLKEAIIGGHQGDVK